MYSDSKYKFSSKLFENTNEYSCFCWYYFLSLLFCCLFVCFLGESAMNRKLSLLVNLSDVLPNNVEMKTIVQQACTMESWDLFMQNVFKFPDKKWYFKLFSQKYFANKSSIFTILCSEGICCSYFSCLFYLQERRVARTVSDTAALGPVCNYPEAQSLWARLHKRSQIWWV